MKKIYFLLALVSIGFMSYGQTGSVTGTVTTDDGPSIGAVAKLAGTSKGALTDLNGNFIINDVEPGDYNLIVSSVGYDEYSSPISVTSGQVLSLGSLALSGGSVALKGVEITSDIAIDRKTPVAVSNIDGDYIGERTGSQDITAVMAVAPSTFASTGTGGFGDSRLTVRGFDDTNVVVMVNGVPVNDLENDALFWSNWAGLADSASKIQIQRGLGASLLAVPSVGGTVNIITKASDQKKGGFASASIGNDLYRKYNVQLSTGEMQNGWAFTFQGSRTSGDGYVDGNFIDAYSYFGSASKEWKNHSLVLTGFGAPQRHGQGFRRRLSTFVAPSSDGQSYEDFIRESNAMDFDGRAQELTNGSANSIRYNSGWGYISRNVNNGFTHESESNSSSGSEQNVFNQFSNFFHKPQVNLSHYWDVNDRLEIVSNAYWSVGRGGGGSDWRNFSNSGGHRWFNYQTNGGPVDWDALQARNIALNPDLIAEQGSDQDPFYFFRASYNVHEYEGLLSKAIYDINENLVFTGGVDARIYNADHVRGVIDTFGLTGFTHSDFGTGQTSVASSSSFLPGGNSLFNRDNTAFVNWVGAYSELEYTKDKWNAVFGASGSNKSYKKVQRVAATEGVSDFENFLGGTIKGGANYNVTDALNVYGNVGYLEIQPIFDNVFLGGNNGGVDGAFLNEDAPNERVFGLEAGAGISTSKFAANLNLYRTQWNDRALTVTDEIAGGELIFGNAFGIDALHQGIELDLRVQPVSSLDITGALSFGDWEWTNNGTFQLFDQQGVQQGAGEFFVEDVKVGNAPQSQANIGANYTTPFGIALYGQYQHNWDYFTLLEVDDRTDPNAVGVDPNELPDFGFANAGINYTLPLNGVNQLRFDLNFVNVFDQLFVVEARESFDLDGNNQPVYDDLQNLTGNFGLGRTWTSGVKLVFGDTPKVADTPTVSVPVPEPMAEKDSDGDGVLDSKDDCPSIPGTIGGCPDSDGDGLIDSRDDCPSEAGLATDGGCPAKVMDDEPEVIIEERVVEVEVNSDSDGDGVVDSKDNCPDVAGAITNFGCPAVAAAPVVTTEVVERLNFIAKNVYFNTNSDVLKSESKVRLDEIALIMSQYPGTTFVVEGHTDNVGDAGYNKDLSQRRAQSVVDYLVGKNVSGSSLSAVGYGEDSPIASNDTAEGRQQNRRVVIRLR